MKWIIRVYRNPSHWGRETDGCGCLGGRMFIWIKSRETQSLHQNQSTQPPLFVFTVQTQHVLIHPAMQRVHKQLNLPLTWAESVEPSNRAMKEPNPSCIYLKVFYLDKQKVQLIIPSVYLLCHSENKPQLLFFFLSPSFRHRRSRPAGEDTARHCPRRWLSWPRRESSSQLAAAVNSATVQADRRRSETLRLLLWKKQFAEGFWSDPEQSELHRELPVNGCCNEQQVFVTESWLTAASWWTL